MVIPSTPIPLSASFTSSSLCGWIIASIFFMAACRPDFSSSRFEIITLFAVHADVQPLQLLLGRNAYTDQNIADFENDQRSDDRKAPGDRHADRLVQHLAGMPVDKAQPKCFARAVLETIVDGHGGKNAGENRTDGSAGAMHSERI